MFRDLPSSRRAGIKCETEPSLTSRSPTVPCCPIGVGADWQASTQPALCALELLWSLVSGLVGVNRKVQIMSFIMLSE